MTPLLSTDWPLCGMSAKHFLAHYWQKKPLLLRGALPDFIAPVSPSDVFELAAREDVESRLIAYRGGRWSMKNGPVDAVPRAKRDWTVLVNGVNLYDAHADALMRSFDFLPQTRLDDLMVSYAVDGGGVGPHFDSYDVFLLQAHGQRRWRVGSHSDLTLRDDVPLKVLANFTFDDEYLLGPGDMLYLPPHIAHEGVAVGECMTYSIGFRAPDHAELVRQLLYRTADDFFAPGRFTDAGRSPTRHPARVDSLLVAQLREQLNAVRWTAEDLRHFIGSYFSEPKNHVVFARNRAAPGHTVAAMRANGVVLDLKTQMLYDADTLFVNGDIYTLDAPVVSFFNALADARRATGAACSAALEHPLARDLLLEWHLHGWLQTPKKSRKGR